MAQIGNNLFQGKVLHKLVLFALPFLASNFVQSLYSVSDMLIIGHFAGTESMSGVNIGGQVTLMLTNIVIGLCIGGTVLIGQYTGAGNEEKLKRVITTLITLLVILSFFTTAVMLFLRKPILRLLQTPPESFAESERYLTVTLLGIIFIFGYNALAAILRGMGNSKQPFYFITIACITNIILNFVFVVGLKLGALGVAITTVISQGLSVILCIRYMVKNNFQFDFKLSSYRIYKDQLKLIFKVGLPTCIQNSVVGLSFAFLTAMVNIVGGVTASAGVGAAGRFNSFVFMPVMAMSASISAMSAQNFGAGRVDRAVSACKIGAVFSFAVSLFFFILVMLFPTGVLRLFGNDPQMIHDGAIYLRSFAWDFLLIPFIFCVNGLFIGGGHTIFTLISSVLSSLFLRIPACYFFGVVLGWGLKGIGLGAPIASAGVIFIIIGYLLSGKWKHNVINHARPTLEPGISGN